MNIPLPTLCAGRRIDSFDIHRRGRGRDAAFCLILSLFALALQGLDLNTSDLHNMLPHLLALDDPELFAQDFAFRWPPNAYYGATYRIFAWIGGMTSWSFLFGVLALLDLYMLSLASIRIVESLGGRRPRLCGSLAVILCLNGSNLVGGYHVSHPCYAQHYTAIAAALLAISCSLRRQDLGFLCLLALTLLFNLRIGFFCLCLAWIGRVAESGRSWLTALAALTTAAAVVGSTLLVALCFPQQTSPEIASIWLLFRAPWHWLPSHWSAAEYIGLSLFPILLFTTFRPCPEDSIPALRQLAAIVSFSCLMLFVGILNNHLFLKSALTLASLLEFGPFALYFCLIAALRRPGRPFPLFLGCTLAGTLVYNLAVKLTLLIVGTSFPFSRTPQVGVRLNSAIVRPTLFLVLAGLLVYRMPFAGLNLCSCLAVCALGFALLRSRLSGELRCLVLLSSMTVLAIPLNPRWTFNTSTYAVLPAGCVQMTDHIRNHTPQNSCFLMDPWFSDFQIRARRSSFVSFFHIPHRIEFLPAWLARIRELKSLPAMRMNGGGFESLSDPAIAETIERHPEITHILSQRKRSFPEVIHFGHLYLYARPLTATNPPPP